MNSQPQTSQGAPIATAPGVTSGSRRWLTGLLLAAILLVGAGLRFVGLNWDQNQHLHPDERFLTMVTDELEWPATLAEYWVSATNPLNPYNHEFGTYVYGLLPVIAAKFAGELTGYTGYDGVFLAGRALSGIYDLGSVLLVFLIGRRLYDRRVGLVGALLAALSVLNIQHSRFFTVDIMTTFFVTLSLYLAVRVAQGEGWGSILGLGLAFGLAVSSKISVLTFLLVIGLALLLRTFARPAARARPQPMHRTRRLQLGPWRLGVHVERDDAEPMTPIDTVLWKLIGAGLILGVVVFVGFWAFRVAQPQAFTGPGLFGLTINPLWLGDMVFVQRLVSGAIDFPPSHQWAARAPVWYMLENLVLWGVGLPMGLAIWAAWGLMAWQMYRRNRWAHLLPWVWMTFTFFFQSVQFVKTIRYLLPIYPTMALMAGWGLVWLWDCHASQQRGRWRLPLRMAARGAAVAVVIGTAFWALAFASIYTRPHTRVAASRWIYQNIAPGSSITYEVWDDTLPLNLDGYHRDSLYSTVRMEPYWEDTPEKRELLVQWLDEADYIILSSNRLYGSIPRLPMRYPMTTRYYEALFAGELGFDLVQEFTSRPRLLGIEIVTDYADETFTVYDHPKVLIFQKRDDFDLRQVRALFDDLDLERVLRIMPRQVNRAPNNLMLDEDVWQAQRQRGAWSEMFDRADLRNRFPTITWGLAVALLGVVGWPLLFPFLRHLADGGFGLARMGGLLLLGYLPWLAASNQALPFAPRTVVAVLALLALAAGVAAWAQRRALIAFIRSRWRMLLLSEVLFWAFFFAFWLIRRGNPDLWHPVMGGEKPMDLAYLNAILRSEYMPPFDPWFAGGYINYYYWGWVPVAALILLTGIVPTVAYNLALPTLFALLAAGVVSVVAHLLPSEGDEGGWLPLRWRFGLLGALLVAVAGNLGQLRLLWQGSAEVGRRLAGGPAPNALAGVMQALRGGWAVIARGEALAFRPEWWYWNASRIMPYGEINEFPFFTFLYGDLHAHLMAMPITVFALGLAVALIGRRCAACGETGVARRVDWAFLGHALWLGLALGALWCANSWDYPTYTGIAVAALAIAALTTQPLNRRTVAHVALQAALVVGLGYLLFLPFHHHFGLAYNSVRVWRGERTALGDYLLIQLPFLFILTTYLIWTARGPIRRSPWFRSLRLQLASQHRQERIQRLRWLLARRPTLAYSLAWAALLVAAVVVVVLALLGLWPSLLALVLLALGAVALLMPGVEPKRRMLALLIGVGLALSLFVEWLVLEGDIGRMNTVFKLYLQVWVLWGVSSAIALGWLASAGVSRMRPWRGRLWRLGLAVLLVGMATYPLLATPAKIHDRWGVAIAPTLDGMAYMDVARYHDQGRELTLAHDAQAIRWLQENVLGTPVIVEANALPYRWGSRISVYTGLPTIVGWDWHQRQQRAALSSTVVDWRLQDLRELYDTPSIERALELLDKYQVGLIYVGELERAYYSEAGLAKFEAMVGQHLDVVYRQGPVTIYRVLGAGVRLVQPLPGASWGEALRDRLARRWVPPTVAAQAPPPADATLMLDVPVEDLPVVDGRGWNRAATGSTPLAIASWWMAMLLIGLAGWPLAARLFPDQPDRGWALARGLGLLLVGYVLWTGASVRLFRNDLAGVWGALGGVALVSWVALWPRRSAWRLRWRAVLRAELLFGGAFLLWVGIRILNPDLWQPWFGGEKMMEMALLNALARSAYMPPYDPYFAGGILNYYYYGFMLTLVPMRLSGLAPEVAFNLAVPMFFALTVAHAYWVVSRLLWPGVAHRWAGAAAVLLAVGIGNLSGASQLLAPLAQAGCPAGAQGLVQGLGCLGRGLSRALSGAVGPPAFDYWHRSTRIIPYTINEFPLFTFLFADLHPHLMAIPFALLAIAGAALTLRGGSLKRMAGLAVLLAFLLGALGVINTWDLPIHLLIVMAVLAARGYQTGGLKGAATGGLMALAIGLGALLLYAPFYQHYRPQYVGLAFLRPYERTQVGPFVEIWGLFLWILIGAQAWGLATLLPWRVWCAVSRLGLASWLASSRRRGRRALLSRLALAPAGGVALVAGVAMLIRGPFVWPTMALLMLPTAILCWAAVTDRRRRMTWLLIAAAQGILLGIEFIYLSDFLAGSEWRRMNTVFKFSLQAWMLLALGLGSLVPQMLRARTAGLRAATRAWAAVGAVLLAGSLVYPVLGIPARVADRFPSGSPPIGTLDGTAYMREARYYWPDDSSPIEMRHDREAIAWLWEYVQGTPVLAEAPVGYYREGGLRISSYTGLPTLVGAHQTQQRPAEQVIARKRDAERIFGTEDPQELLDLLGRHRVRLIYIGPLERALYPASSLATFSELAATGALELVYRNEQVNIYRVPAAAGQGGPAGGR